MENRLTDEHIIKALEWLVFNFPKVEKPENDSDRLCNCINLYCQNAVNELNRQKAEIVKLEKIKHFADKTIEAFKRENEKQKTEIERLESDLTLKTYDYEHLLMKCKELQAISSSRKDRLMQTVVKLQTAKSEAINEFAEKVTEIFKRYAHLHNYADQARRAEVEAADGTKIEMRSVWDAITLRKHEMAEYEEMSELQRNIEILEKDRLLTELEKDFRLLVKEMEGESK